MAMFRAREKMSQELPYLNQPKNTLKFGSLSSIRQRLLRFWRPSGFTFGKPGKQWKGQREAISHYWSVYGGSKALLLSPYLHVSLALTAICLWRWAPKVTASEIAVSVLPN